MAVGARAHEMGDDDERKDRDPHDPEQIFPPPLLSRRDRLQRRRASPWGPRTRSQLLARAGVGIPKTIFSRGVTTDIDDLIENLGGNSPASG